MRGRPRTEDDGSPNPAPATDAIQQDRTELHAALAELEVRMFTRIYTRVCDPAVVVDYDPALGQTAAGGDGIVDPGIDHTVLSEFRTRVVEQS